MNDTAKMAGFMLLCAVFLIGGAVIESRSQYKESLVMPSDHVMVSRDQRGRFWIAKPTDEQWQSCVKCHGQKWNTYGGDATPYLLEKVNPPKRK